MYAILTKTLGGWEDCWTIEEKIDGEFVSKPDRYITQDEAQAEIDEIIADSDEQIANGERGEDEGYSQDDYRIVPVEQITAFIG